MKGFTKSGSDMIKGDNVPTSTNTPDVKKGSDLRVKGK